MELRQLPTLRRNELTDPIDPGGVGASSQFSQSHLHIQLPGIGRKGGEWVRWGSSSGGVDPEPEGLWHTWLPAKAEPETFGFKPFWHLLPSTKGTKKPCLLLRLPILKLSGQFLSPIVVRSI